MRKSKRRKRKNSSNVPSVGFLSKTAARQF